MGLTLYYAGSSHTPRATPVSPGMTRPLRNRLCFVGHLFNGENVAGATTWLKVCTVYSAILIKRVVVYRNIFYSHFHVYLYSTDKEWVLSCAVHFYLLVAFICGSPKGAPWNFLICSSRYGAPWGELSLAPLPLTNNGSILHCWGKLKCTKSCRFSQQQQTDD